MRHHSVFSKIRKNQVNNSKKLSDRWHGQKPLIFQAITENQEFAHGGNGGR